MASHEEILELAAKDGSIDVAQWPQVVTTVITRLRDNVYNAFPAPSTTISTHATLDAVAELPVAHEGPRIEEAIGANGPTSAANGQTLPVALETPFTSCLQTLQTTFCEQPPYSVQRLAELVLRPRAHYRFLPPYISALDRVLSVTSTTSEFIPNTQSSVSNANYLANGDTSTMAVSDGLGLTSDESLGGALLTPIPWLKRDNNTLAEAARQRLEADGRGEEHALLDEPAAATMIDVNAIPNGRDTNGNTDEQKPIMSTEQTLRAEGAVTQGELLRQEQEAGVVPVAQARRNPIMTTGILPSMESADQLDTPRAGDMPHARGPEAIGMEDMGPQDEAALGRPINMENATGRRSRSPQPPPADDDKPDEDMAAVLSASAHATDRRDDEVKAHDDTDGRGAEYAEDQSMPDVT